ncbi:putative histidine kinase HHK11p [Phaeosphaeria sp. MPI-PUGE-AT-0046c]|nr:putative histidine kinase HHK11p [Phaeosphaeria sp. MPI-PUGE-AT-0046c]
MLCVNRRTCVSFILSQPIILNKRPLDGRAGPLAQFFDPLSSPCFARNMLILSSAFAAIQGRAPTIPQSTFSTKGYPAENAVAPRGTQYGPYDVTLPNPPESILSDHIKDFRNIDWASTTLGAMASWPPELRTVVNMCLNDVHPCMLFWGDDVIMIYNAAYVQLIGVMHRQAMGRSARTVASDYWPTFQPLVDHINATGQSVSENEIPIFIDRLGFLEETYWSFQFIPVLDNKGHVSGYYHPLFETTRHNLLERRVSSLVELGSQTAKARNLESYWNLALHTLKLNAKDVPLALLYAAENHHSSDAESISSPSIRPAVETYQLKGTIGVQPDHVIAPSRLHLQDETYVLQPFLNEAIKSRKATIVQFESLGLSDDELGSIDWKGFGEPCRTIVVCPLAPTTGEQVEGFLVLGTNPRRPFDDEYQRFAHVMLRLLATSLASVQLFDEEVRQKEKAIGQAAELQEKLLVELKMREKRFQRFAERSDVAIFTFSPDGKFTYRNQRWYDMFDIAVNAEDVMGAWLDIVFPEDLARVEGVFAKLVVDKEAISLDLKTKMPWTPPELSKSEGEAVKHFRWILCSAYPELDASGNLIEITGNVTDISKQKWAEGVQKMRTDIALESKLHLEHFIDTTSHEMRNPLSAIMQSADGILNAYASDAHVPPSQNAWSAFLEQTLDAAQTIAQCAQHMRHIVDDILTISKLDSGLLVITPVDAQPEGLVEHAVKMFEAEAKAARVDISFSIDQTYRDLQLDWVSLDPTRLLQILINLITNAIKFTRLESTRRVNVVLRASVAAPTSVPGGIQFNEEKLVDEDRHLKDDWNQDTDHIHLQFSVTDTGRGLSEDERVTLFTRFSQASPRTHIHYGGSGLGLFISRRLTELQGGAIGLESEPKRGSTFSFYIKTRRIKPTMRRKSSTPNILPEDIRHRPETSRTNISRPPPPLRMPSFQSTDERSNTPPSPRLIRHPAKRRPSLFDGSESPSSLFGHLALQDSSETTSVKRASDSMHVLVVEDNLVNQRVLAKQLRNLGCSVDVANHGREALDHLERTTFWNRSSASSYPRSQSSSYHVPCTGTPPLHHQEADAAPLELHVILLDWEMPIMNGLEAVKHIRQMEADGILIGRVPVIGVTANVRQQQIDTAIEAGMDDVVGKPFRVAELLVKMRRIMENVANQHETMGLGIVGVEEKTDVA